MKENNVIKVVYAILFLFNIQYAGWLFQVPYTFLFDDFRSKSSFASSTLLLKSSAKELKTESAVGFVSEVPSSKVFDLVGPIKNFYAAQYAIVPAILKNDIEAKYVVGIFDDGAMIDGRLKIYKKLNDRIYIFKRSDA